MMHKHGSPQSDDNSRLKAAVRKLRLMQLKRALKDPENHELMVHNAARNNNSLALRYLHHKVPTILQTFEVTEEGNRSVLSSATKAGKLRCAKYILKTDGLVLKGDNSDLHPLLCKQSLGPFSRYKNASKRAVQEYIIKNHFADISQIACHKYLCLLFHEGNQAQAIEFINKMLIHQNSTRLQALKYLCENGSITAIKNALQVFENVFVAENSSELFPAIMLRFSSIESGSESDFFFNLVSKLNSNVLRPILYAAIKKALSDRDSLQASWLVKVAYLPTALPKREVPLQLLVDYLKEENFNDFVYLFEIQLQAIGENVFKAKASFLMRLACMFGKLPIVRLLVKYGIDFDNNHDGDSTPYNAAKLGKCDEVVMWCDIYRELVRPIRKQSTVKAVEFVRQNRKLIDERYKAYLEFTDEFNLGLETLVQQSGNHELLIELNFSLYYPYRDSLNPDAGMVSTSLFPLLLTPNQLQYLTHLMLNNLGLKDEDMSKLSKELPKVRAPFLHTIDLSSNQLTSVSIGRVVNVLECLKTVVRLNLANNNIANYNEKKCVSDFEVTRRLFRVIAKNPRFKILNLSCNRITFFRIPSNFLYLINDVLNGRQSLECIDLSGNYMDSGLPQKDEATPFLRSLPVQRESYFLKALLKRERVKYQREISEAILPAQTVFVLIAYMTHLACLIERIDDTGQSSFYKADLVKKENNEKEGRLRYEPIHPHEMLFPAPSYEDEKHRSSPEYLKFFHFAELRRAKVKVVSKIVADSFITHWIDLRDRQVNGTECEPIPYETFANGTDTHNCSTYLTRTLIKFGAFNSEDKIHKSFIPARALGSK